MKDLPRNTDGKLSAYAWPGGYPIIYIMGDGAVLCPNCANGENGSQAIVAGAGDDGMSDKSWTIMGCDIFYEGATEYCAHCNTPIESAYGDPSEGQDDA